MNEIQKRLMQSPKSDLAERLEFAYKTISRLESDLQSTLKELEELQDLLALTKIPKENIMVELSEYDENGNLIHSFSCNQRYLTCYHGHPILKIWDNAIEASRKRNKPQG